MFLHVDGDIIKYRCGFAAEKGLYVLSRPGADDEGYTYKKDVDSRVKALGLSSSGFTITFSRVVEPVENALHNVKNTIKGILDEFNTADYCIYLSGSTNFRDALATIRRYKGNRKEEHKPTHGPAIVEYILGNYPSELSSNEEADDRIGIKHSLMYAEDKYESVVVSVDKDLDQLPGMHYNFVKKESYWISEFDASRKFYCQLLSGDATDNIQGVPGVGLRGADKLLAGCEDEACMYNVCAAKYNDDKALMENAQLLWIRKKEGEVWQPPLCS